MNIWVVDHYATPPDSPGISRHYDFARQLIAQGHHVTIFASSFNHRTKREERLAPGQKHVEGMVGSVPFVWLRTYPYARSDWRRALNMATYAFRVFLHCARRDDSPDCIIASSPHPLAGLAGYVLSKLRRAGFVFEIRDLWPKVLIEIGGYSPRNPIVLTLGALETFLCRRASMIVVLHPGAANYVSDKGIPEDRIACMPNGVDAEFFDEPPEALPDAHSQQIAELKSRQRMLVAYAGNHSPAYALTTVIDAARLLQDRDHDKVHFLLLGDGSEKAALRQRASQLKLSNLTFLDPVPKSAMPSFLKAIDIGMLPYKRAELLYQYGVSSNKLWEYMLSAKPVILAWDETVSRSLVTETQCGVTVPPEDPLAMAEAISRLGGLSSEERSRIGGRGRDYVMAHHSTASLAQSLLLVIEEGARSSLKRWSG
jgi:glycosyltransferase involved in cell wall biosynthesis